MLHPCSAPKQVGRRSAVTRKLQACPKQIAYKAMAPTGEVDQRSSSSYRRLNGDAEDEVNGCGTCGASLLR
eukprot:9384393-Pyramimonas_sp.AAC.1